MFIIMLILGPHVAGEATADPLGTDEKVSVDLKAVEVRQVFDYIAQILKVNIVVDREVQGEISIRVNAVPISQLFDSILRMEGLYKVEQGRVIYVMPAGKAPQYLPR